MVVRLRHIIITETDMDYTSMAPPSWRGMGRLLLLAFCYLTLVPAQTPPGCDQNMDLVFLVDSSESIREDNPYDGSYDCWSLLTQFVTSVVDNFKKIPSETNVGVVKFSTDPKREFDLFTFNNLGSIKQQIQAMDYLGGNTNLADGLAESRRTLLAGRNVRKVLVVLSDGLSNINNHRTMEEAETLKNNGVLVLSVALTDQHNEDTLRNIATKWSSLLQADGFQALNYLITPLVYLICDQEPLPVCPTGQYFNGLECKECGLKVDLALLVDDSGSIKDKNPQNGTVDNYVFLKTFLKNLVSRLPIGEDATRIGIIRFSHISPKVELYFDQSYDRYHIQNKVIDKMAYTGGETHTGNALEQMRKSLFVPGGGDRQSAKNVAIVVTDGESTNKTFTAEQAQLAKQEGVTFFTVGITNQINVTELKLIASKPVSRHYYNATEFKQLNGLVANVIRQVCDSSATRVKREVSYTQARYDEYNYPRDQFIDINSQELPGFEEDSLQDEGQNSHLYKTWHRIRSWFP